MHGFGEKTQERPLRSVEEKLESDHRLPLALAAEVADFRVVRPQDYGAALVYFTGSKAYNTAIRRRAQQCGLKINEYGVFRGAARVAGNTETSAYEALGLAPIVPELREDRGEIEAAERNRLPELVRREDPAG